MSKNHMNKIFIIFLIIGFYSCGEKQESEKNSESIIIEKAVSQTNGFDLMENFQENQTEFKTDTIRLSDNSANGSGLIFYQSEKNEYLVFDFMVYNDNGIKNYTYWTDKKLNFKFIKQAMYGYKKENTFERYVTYNEILVKVFDSNKNEITDIKFVEKTKSELESFFKDNSSEIDFE